MSNLLKITGNNKILKSEITLITKYVKFNIVIGRKAAPNTQLW